MSLTIFADNYLEDDATTVTATVVGGLGRLYDRDRQPQYQPEPQSGLVDIVPLGLTMSFPAVAVSIDADLGSARAVTGWAAANINVTGVTMVLKGDSTSPATTTRDSLDPLAADFLRTFASISYRYWRFTIPAMSGVVPKIGELMLGVPGVISQEPTIPSGYEHPLANVVTDLSPAGYAWSKLRGSKRMQYKVSFNVLSGSGDYATLKTAFDDCDQGAKNVMLKLPDATVRWARWVEIGEPVALGDNLVRVTATFEQAL